MPEAPYDRFADAFASDIETGARGEFRRLVMYPSVLRAVGDVRGESVLDLACGTGVYARFVRRQGATRVLGVDISANMIGIARAIEMNSPLGVHYLVHDVARLPHLGNFDVALAVTLFNFAESQDSLAAMYERIRANVSPRGRVVALMQNLDFDPQASAIGRFGMHQRGHSAINGSTVLVDLGDPPQTVTTWAWSKVTHERIAHAAGFEDLRWWPHICVADPEHPDYHLMKQYPKNPHMLILSARRSATG